MNKTMTIEITPAIIHWIEGCKDVVKQLEPEFQFIGPGFDEVVEAYDKVMHTPKVNTYTILPPDFIKELEKKGITTIEQFKEVYFKGLNRKNVIESPHLRKQDEQQI